MFKGIRGSLKKILGVLAVSNNGYTIKQRPDTANEAGMVYCVTKTATGEASDIFVHYEGRDISPEALKVLYVDYSVNNQSRTSRDQPTVHYKYIKQATGELTPVSSEHRQVLFAYFEEKRLRKHGAVTRPAEPVLSAALSELNV